jgi:hypothetical protein
VCTANGGDCGSSGFGSVAEALRAGEALADYLNSPAVTDLDGSACGEVLAALAGIQSRLSAAAAGFLRRFDAADAHDADGYGSSSAWLAAMANMTKRDAKAAVRRMRQLSERPHLGGALGRGEISDSWAREIIDWLKKLPEELRAGTEKILAEAAAAGASLEDLATITAHALARWQADHPDEDDDGFPDRYLQIGTTFGGAGVIRGDLTPECAAAVTAVLEALGKRAGPEDDRTEKQRFHDALQLACELLLRARLVPDRAGADTQVVVNVSLRDLRAMDGAADLEDAWVRALLGDGGCLTGKDAEAAACDAMTVPIVAGTMDATVLDQMIELVLGAFGHREGPAREPRDPVREALARLAVDLVSGPAGAASTLRRGLLEHPWNTPSVPLDIGYSDTIPASIRRAVLWRDKYRCAWPRCGRPAAWCDVHHITHKKDGGKTSADSCVCLCQYHHDICIHRDGWRIVLHPDGTTSVYGPQGQVQHSNSPP